MEYQTLNICLETLDELEEYSMFCLEKNLFAEITRMSSKTKNIANVLHTLPSKWNGHNHPYQITNVARLSLWEDFRIQNSEECVHMSYISITIAIKP